MCFELDGTFPNHEANRARPTWSICRQRCSETGADIGLAFDGDADRCFVVDELGKPCFAQYHHRPDRQSQVAREPGSSVIHNLITSAAVPDHHEQAAPRSNPGPVISLHQGDDGGETGAVFGSEPQGLLLPDFGGPIPGMLAAPTRLGRLGRHPQERR